MNQQAPRFVRINLNNHPMYGMIGTTTDELTEDGFKQVRLLKSSISGYFRPQDLQAIEVGTKVLIEVTISDFFQDSMMIAGGWTPLTRILDIKEILAAITMSMDPNKDVSIRVLLPGATGVKVLPSRDVQDADQALAIVKATYPAAKIVKPHELDEEVYRRQPQTVQSVQVVEVDLMDIEF